ncbi:MAG: hypothetical protein ACKOEO_02045 [Planctomycetaceae bacterium]
MEKGVLKMIKVKFVCLIVLFGLFADCDCLTASGDDDHRKNLIRAAAYLNLSQVHSLDVKYQLTDASGAVSTNRLILSGTMARIDKDELIRGQAPPGSPEYPGLYSHRSAFNNIRSQSMEPRSKFVTLKDGNDGFSIPWTTPATFPFSGWLGIKGAPLWDKLLDEAVWEKAFRDARLGGLEHENVVIFQHDEKHDLVVTFNADAMYLPVRVERIDRGNGVVTGRLIVKKWANLGTEESRHCLATEVVSETLSGSSGGFRKDACLQVDEEQFRVNQPVDVSLFTLEIPEDFKKYDVDEVNRYSQTVTQMHQSNANRFNPPPPPERLGYGTAFAVLAVVLIASAAVLRWRQS